MKGVDQHEVHLKTEFIRITFSDAPARERIPRLANLRTEFEEVENYRVGVTDIDVGENSVIRG